MDVKIDSNVPLPESRGTYPLDQLEVGDSFSVPVEKTQSLRSTVYLFNKTHPDKKFTVKSKGGETRVWRLK